MIGAMRRDGHGVDEAGGGLTGRRVVITTFGSLGDLHPFLSLAVAVKRRGGVPVMATSEMYRERVVGQGIEFFSVPRPHFEGMEQDPGIYRRAMDLKTGGKFVVQELFMRHVRDSYDDLSAAVVGADLLISHVVAFAGPLVAEVTGIPWVSAVLSPMSMFSMYDPPVPPPAPWLGRWHSAGPVFWGPLFWLARRMVRGWCEPVHQLRRDLGLRPVGEPLIEGGQSPDCVLAMFSETLGKPQRDWPRQTVQTGFAFLDDSLREGPFDPAARSRISGRRPGSSLSFTLGSSAVMDAGRFYEESLAVSQAAGQRAVLLLIGSDPRNARVPLPEVGDRGVLCPVLVALFAVRGGCSSRRSRHDRTGLAVRPADAGGPLESRSARQLRLESSAGRGLDRRTKPLQFAVGRASALRRLLNEALVRRA